MSKTKLVPSLTILLLLFSATASGGSLGPEWLGFTAPDDALRAEGIDTQAAKASNDCYALSNTVTALIHYRNQRPTPWMRVDESLISAVGLVAPLPAFGALGYNAYRDTERKAQTQAVQERIHELRERLASLSCFVRD